MHRERVWDGHRWFKHVRLCSHHINYIWWVLSSQLQTVRETVNTRMAYAGDINLPPAYHKDPGGGTASFEPVPLHFIDQEQVSIDNVRLCYRHILWDQSPCQSITLSVCSYVCHWNQLPSSFRQPHSSPSVSVLPAHAPTTSHFVISPVSPSTTPSLFHSRLKTYLFTNLSHHRLPSSLRADSTDSTTGPFLLSISVFFVCTFFITLFFVSFRAAD